MDVNAIRDPHIAMHGLFNADARLTLYYDETNNIRKLITKPDGLNARDPKVFVLGGIAHHGSPRDLGFEALRASLSLPQDVSELKFNQIGSGEFLDVLRSAKMETFLRWITGQELFVHFQALDVLYWSTVDIVDSILAETHAEEFTMLHRELKNTLYSVLRSDEAQLAELYHRYDYPNVGRERRSAFVAELLDLVVAKRPLVEPFEYQMLKGLLQMAMRLDSLPFLEDEEPNVLLDGFSNFYIQRICILKNSYHILDIEKVIQARLAGQSFMDGDQELGNHQFVDSKDEVGVQVADAMVGLIGRAFTYANRTSRDQIQMDLGSLNDQQQRNLDLLASLIDQSTDENEIFAHYLISSEDKARMAILLGV